MSTMSNGHAEDGREAQHLATLLDAKRASGHCNLSKDEARRVQRALESAESAHELLAEDPDAPRAGGETPDTPNPPSVPSLDVEACAGLLAELANNPDFYHLHPRAVASLDNLRHFLLEALPGMGKDSERLDALSVPGATARVYMNALANRANPPMRLAAEVSIPSGMYASHVSVRSTLRDAIDAARAAQPQETSADAT